MWSERWRCGGGSFAPTAKPRLEVTDCFCRRVLSLFVQDVDEVPFYTKDGSCWSDSEVLVIGLLVARPATVADASARARDVLQDCSDNVAGEP